ncbi:MAG: hypothetical protein LLG20_12925 [Acidobacteriales bacterium]|nr:hypothetical protein [Terriglobales bacterium]
MDATSAFWRDLESRFRELLNIPEAARLTGNYFSGQCGLIDGPTDKSERAWLYQLFPPLARAGAIKAGAPNGADPLNAWLNLLRAESPHFHQMGVPDGGGWIQNLVLASAEYCIVRAARAFEFETAALAGVPALSDQTKRKLAVQLNTLRDKQKLTDEDISGYDRERQRCLKMPADHGTNPAESEAKGRKRGPKPDHESALRVAEIVARVAPHGDWRPRLDDLCEALDEDQVPYPARWRKRDRTCNGWAAYDERAHAVKAIEYRLKIAKQRKKATSETFS